MKRLCTSIIAALFLAGCAHHDHMAPVAKMKDGELPLPAGYQSWSMRLAHVEKDAAKQVRDIYINDIGRNSGKSGKFANGTVAVMELHKAKANPDGSLAKDANGKLMKDGLMKVFVMGKGKGWGETAPEALRNGDWIYSSYMANGTTSPDPAAACRACHLKIGESKDWLGRFDEYVVLSK